MAPSGCSALARAGRTGARSGAARSSRPLDDVRGIEPQQVGRLPAARGQPELRAQHARQQIDAAARRTRVRRHGRRGGRAARASALSSRYSRRAEIGQQLAPMGAERERRARARRPASTCGRRPRSSAVAAHHVGLMARAACARCGQPQWRAIWSHTASIAALRALLLRHTAPMRRLGAGPREGAHRHALGAAVGAARGQRRQQRHAGAGGDHLPQRLDAGGAKILLLVHAAAAADRERLVAQAVSVLEQQQRLAAEVLEAHLGARGQRMRLAACASTNGSSYSSRSPPSAPAPAAPGCPHRSRRLAGRSSIGSVWYSYSISSSRGSARRSFGATRGSR